MSGFSLSQRSKDRLQGVDPRLIQIVELAIQLTVIDFGVPQYGGLRTEEEQKELFRTRKSKTDGVRKKSRHQSGKAFDVFAYVDGEASWDELHLAMVAAAVLQAASMLGYKLMWGGLWTSFKDMPHFELVD